MTETEIRIDRWFNRYKDAKRSEKIWSKQADYWTERALSVTKEITDMPRAASPNTHTDDAYAERLDCARTATDYAKKSKAVMESVERAIAWAEDPICRDFLRLRYIEGLSILRTAIELNTTDRNVYNIRRNAFKYYTLLDGHGGASDSLLPAAVFENKYSNRLSCSLYFRSTRVNV